MASGNEPVRMGRVTKLLLVAYLASGLIGLIMALWFVVVVAAYFIGGEKVSQSLPIGFLWPWLPLAVFVMFAAKFAMLGSHRRDGGREAR